MQSEYAADIVADPISHTQLSVVLGMDLLTQSLIGAGLAQTGARGDELRLATGIGLVAGLLADADVLIQSSADPLLQIEYHRHFTHSIFFIPLGALIAALLFWPLLRRRLPLARIYLYSLLGYALSGFLDVCTSYGTYWLWPLIDQRISFNLISIVDPLFTVFLLVGVIYSWRGKSAVPSRIALLLAGGYLLLGWLQHDRAQQEIAKVAADRGHPIERMLVKPTMGNNLLWRSIYESGGQFHVDAVRVGIGAARTYSGGSVNRYRPEESSITPPADSILAADIRRFSDFSDGFVIRHAESESEFESESDNHRLGDIRYAMLPTSTQPLWGIQFDLKHPDRHASYNFYRSMSGGDRKRFFEMLLAR